MKRLIAFSLLAIASFAQAATTVPVQLLNPTGSTAGQAIVSNGPGTPPAWASVSLTNTSGTLPINRGGTGATTASAALSALGGAALAGSAAQPFSVGNATTATQAEARGQSISSGTAQDMTSSRVFGTTYTNTTGRPIFVFATGLTTTAAITNLSAKVDGIFVGVSPSTGTQVGLTTSLSFLVPPGSTYSVNLASGAASVNIWNEIR